MTDSGEYANPLAQLVYAALKYRTPFRVEWDDFTSRTVATVSTRDAGQQLVERWLAISTHSACRMTIENGLLIVEVIQ